MSEKKPHSQKPTHTGIKSLLEKYGCTFMWSEEKFNNEYKNQTKTVMEYRGCCGHIWNAVWKKTRKRFQEIKNICCFEVQRCQNCPVPFETQNQFVGVKMKNLKALPNVYMYN